MDKTSESFHDERLVFALNHDNKLVTVLHPPQEYYSVP